MKSLRYSEFIRKLKRFRHLSMEGGKGSEIKVFGKDANGIHRMHVLGRHGKNPMFSKWKVMAFLAKFGIDPDDFFRDE